MFPCSKDIEGAQPQTAVVTAHCPGQGVVRTSDVRVSERTPLMQIRQKFFGPIYNQLADDVSHGLLWCEGRGGCMQRGGGGGSFHQRGVLYSIKWV